MNQDHDRTTGVPIRKVMKLPGDTEQTTKIGFRLVEVVCDLRFIHMELERIVFHCERQPAFLKNKIQSRSCKSGETPVHLHLLVGIVIGKAHLRFYRPQNLLKQCAGAHMVVPNG